MKTLSFKQHNKKAALSFTVVYLTVIFLLLYFLFHITDIASKAGNTIIWGIAGCVIGVGIMLSYLMMLQLFHQNLHVEISRYQMVVYTKGKQEKRIRLEDIGRMELNTNTLNRLDIYDRQNTLLISFHPANEVRTTRNIIEELSGHVSFKLKKDNKVYARTRIETFTYTRRI